MHCLHPCTIVTDLTFEKQLHSLLIIANLDCKHKDNDGQSLTKHIIQQRNGASVETQCMITPNPNPDQGSHTNACCVAHKSHEAAGDANGDGLIHAMKRSYKQHASLQTWAHTLPQHAIPWSPRMWDTHWQFYTKERRQKCYPECQDQ